MKTIFILTVSAIILSSGQANSASADTSVLRSNLTAFGFGTEPSSNLRVTGQIMVDFDRKRVTLEAQPAYNCLPDQACPQVVYQAIELTLPITKLESGDCGNTVITAQDDRRPVDGPLQVLRITDHSQSDCQFSVPTEALLRTVIQSRLSGYGESTTYFGGTVLQVPTTLR